jgi:hypothetical protein
MSDGTTRPSSGNSRSDNDEHRGDDDADDPTDPVGSRRRRNSQRGRQVVAKQDAGDPQIRG